MAPTLAPHRSRLLFMAIILGGSSCLVVVQHWRDSKYLWLSSYKRHSALSYYGNYSLDNNNNNHHTHTIQPTSSSFSSSTTTSSSSSSSSPSLLPTSSSGTVTVPPPLPLPDWLEAYIQWHGEQLHANNESHHPYSYLTYQCVQFHNCGGIGDRLNGIIQSFYTALCNNRVFLIDYRVPFPLTTTLQPHRILWNTTSTSTSTSSSTSSSSTSSSSLHNHSKQLYMTWRNNRNHPILMEPALLSQSKYLSQIQGLLVSNNQWKGGTLASSTCLQDYIRRHTNNNNINNNNNTTKNNTTRQQNRRIHHDDLYRWAFHALFQISTPLQERVQLIQQRVGLLQVQVNNNNKKEENDDNKEVKATIDSSSSSSSSNNNITTPHPTLPLVLLQPYVAVHIRTGVGSNFGDPIRHWGNATFWKFLQCAQRLQHQLANDDRTIMNSSRSRSILDSINHDTNQTLPISSFKSSMSSSSSSSSSSLPLVYVASDNVNVKRQLYAWDSSMRYDPHIQVIHADRTYHPSWSSYLDAWAEWIILWKAQALVMSHSTYSKRASVMGQFTQRTARYFDDCDPTTIIRGNSRDARRRPHARTPASATPELIWIGVKSSSVHSTPWPNIVASVLTN